MAESTAEKTHDPTPHRRQQARDQGHVARSQDVGSAIVLVGGVLGLMQFGQPMLELLGQVAHRQLGGEAWLSTDPAAAVGTLNGLLWAVATVLIPLLGLLLVLALAGNLLQTGLLFLPSKAAPDFSRISPLTGLSRLFSTGNVARLGFGFAKLSVVGVVAGYVLVAERDRVLSCGQLPLPQLAALLIELLLGTMLKIGLALLAVAGADYAYARWRHERDLRMSTAELREEMRNLQGNLQNRSRRRAFGRQALQPAITGDIARADVVVTDAGGIAVALRYDQSKSAAPRVVATGRGAGAAKMQALAAQRRMPIVDRPPLARELERVAVNRPIPAQLYAQVAELLAVMGPAAEA